MNNSELTSLVRLFLVSLLFAGGIELCPIIQDGLKNFSETIFFRPCIRVIRRQIHGSFNKNKTIIMYMNNYKLTSLVQLFLISLLFVGGIGLCHTVQDGLKNFPEGVSFSVWVHSSSNGSGFHIERVGDQPKP